MLTNLTFIYEGDGRFRLHDVLPELEVNQAFKGDLTPIEFLLDDAEDAPGEKAEVSAFPPEIAEQNAVLETPPALALDQNGQGELGLSEAEREWNAIPRAPSEEAVWASMGVVEIQDRAVAEWVAFSPEASEWNLAFNEITDESAS